MPLFNEIDCAQLMRLIGTPDAPVLIDLRIPADLAADAVLIPTATCMPHSDIRAAAAGLRDRRVVLICHRGRKISHGAAAQLRLDGVRAEVLTGGMVAWREAGLPVVPVAAIPARIEGSTLWVTRHRPKIDRIACPWLIRRFIDPQARFLFVPPADVPTVAEVFGATPFDIEGVFWSHRGTGCTFDTMLAEFGLQTGALARLALVVRGADTDAHDLAPQAAGLLAMSVGLSRLYRDDIEQLAAAMPLYDALYRWARDGFDEGHDWPAAKPA